MRVERNVTADGRAGPIGGCIDSRSEESVVTSNVQPSPDPLTVLYRLHTQLRLVTPLLTVAPDTPEVAAMLAGLADTTTQATTLLTAAEPDTLAALRRAFGYAKARRHHETASELVTAHGRLSVLLRRDQPHRPAAADEPTLRWRIEPER
jgi:hypothetical protein